MNDNYILTTEYSPQEMFPAGLELGLGLIPPGFNVFIGGWDEATCTPRLQVYKLGPIILKQFYSQSYASIIHQGLLTIMKNR